MLSDEDLVPKLNIDSELELDSIDENLVPFWKNSPHSGL
jgi:hypothetical protein